MEDFKYKPLIWTTLVISGCSIVYELLISSVSSYLLGDSIKQFSITIGLYMCAMGLGSYLSQFIKKKLFDVFFAVEVGVGLFGGVSALLLFLSNIYIKQYHLVMYGQIILIGTLVGLEIPLLTRIIEKYCHNLRVTLASVFSFDYLGGLIGAIGFPLILLPQLGYVATAFFVGTLNVAVAIFIVFKYKDYMKYPNLWKTVSIILGIVLLVGTLFADTITQKLEDSLYRDQIIHMEQTPYQKIVVTRHKNDLRLYLDGNIQFSSQDEYRYHEALVHIPMSLAPQKKHVLVLGGGDGLAVREILKYDEVETITLVDLDEQMVKLCKEHPLITKLNEGGLSHPKVQCVYEDAYKFLIDSQMLYDVVVIDLPDPNNDTLNKLYTNIFYRLVGNHLTADGVMSVQSTSPYYAKEAFWCVYKTLQSEGFSVAPYKTEVPAFGTWGFHLASKKELMMDGLTIQVPTRYLDQSMIRSLFELSKDEKVALDTIQTNTLAHPMLIEYYKKSVQDWD
ncbi:MAG: polyamine aminopropyltransferase [Cellulosilyticaceae bacterium]